MPEENRVFDVARPGHGSPQATSKPVIVGHQTGNSDPMVMDSAMSDGSHLESSPTRINVQDQPQDQLFVEPDAHPSEPAYNSGPTDMASGPFSENTAIEEQPTPDYSSSTPPEPAGVTEPYAAQPTDFTEPANTEPGLSPNSMGHVEGLHMSEPKRRSPLKAILLILLLLLIGAYLALDSGLIHSSIKLPFHVFKQKTITPAVSPPAATQNNSTAASTLPNGFTEYKLATTSITFAAPTSWGQPTSASDPGYSSRSATAKSDGTYAYVVDFATNKNIQIAVTSSKYLPAARDARYYDFLGWCTGTSDKKVYLSTLKFTTSADKVDTPTTVSCDVGPVADATKVDNATLVQLKTKTGQGAVLGDLYTRNLANSALPVLRVLDKTMADSANIKLLLGTVKAPAAADTTSQ